MVNDISDGAEAGEEIIQFAHDNKLIIININFDDEGTELRKHIFGMMKLINSCETKYKDVPGNEDDD